MNGTDLCENYRTGPLHDTVTKIDSMLIKLSLLQVWLLIAPVGLKLWLQ